MTQSLENFMQSPAAVPMDRPTGVDRLRSAAACDSVIAGVVRVKNAGENRRWVRQPYDETILLMPVELDGETPAGPPVVVRGLDISMAGISFAHDRPFAGRSFVAGLRDAFGNVQSLMVSLTWTRFENGGGYQSGGRFLRPSSLVLPPLAEWSECERA